MALEDEIQLNAAELAELSALADGTLDPARREAVQARIDASPELRTRFEREQRVVGVLHQARARDRAPDQLRARIEQSRRQSAGRRLPALPQWRIGFAATSAVALAAVIAVVALVIPAGTPGAPSVSQAAALSLRPATAPGPRPDPDDPQGLNTNVQGLYFPNWPSPWRATGERSDRIDGRQVTTVYYASKYGSAVYSIVASPVLRQAGGQAVKQGGLEIRTLRIDGRTVVTWREWGHTCVLSSRTVPTGELQELAALPAPHHTGS